MSFFDLKKYNYRLVGEEELIAPLLDLETEQFITVLSQDDDFPFSVGPCPTGSRTELAPRHLVDALSEALDHALGGDWARVSVLHTGTNAIAFEWTRLRGCIHPKVDNNVVL
jgi:hypothetical protein